MNKSPATKAYRNIGYNKTMLAVLFGISIFQSGAICHADIFLRLNSVKFTQTNGATTSISTDRKILATTLPVNTVKDLKIKFQYNFAGQKKHGNVEHAQIFPTNYQRFVHCKLHSTGHMNTNLNRVGECTANKAYLNNLSSRANVNLRINSPGGGGYKYLTWRINPLTSIKWSC